MIVHRSNRTEVLVESLAEILRQPAGGPFDPEWIVVQSRGMATWLSQELARRLSVWANADFLFPRRFAERVLHAVLGDERGAAPSDAHLFWTVLAVLPEALPRPELALLRRYLRHDPQGVRRFQLARRIAQVLDQYLTYRPEMVLRWQQQPAASLSGDEAWQAALWRLVVARLAMPHLAERDVALVRALQKEPAPGTLPRRISVFGIASLPPSQSRMLAALGRWSEVHLFLLSPSQEHWVDLVAPREQARLLRAAGGGAELHLDDGPPLLASLGQTGAEFERVLEEALEALGDAAEERADYREPDGDGLLATLQRDLLHLTTPKRSEAPVPSEVRRAPARRAPARRRRVDMRDRTPLLPFGEGDATTTSPPPSVAPSPAAARPRLSHADPSIRLHSCHGAMREVEVLHDQLLDLLAQDTGLHPRDVIVMVSDVDRYAPLIEAVFEREPGDPRFIPYRIADRTVQAESPCVAAFLQILALVGGRAPASAVVDLLRLMPVQRRFRLEAGDLDTLIHWIADAGVRWGLDDRHRESHGQPALRENTWRFGLDRMLLGYAMPGGGRETFADVLPYDEIEGLDAALLGKLADFEDRLANALQKLAMPRRLPEWRDELGRTLEEMLDPGLTGAWELERIRGALAALADEAEQAGFEGEVDLAALRPLLAPRIDEIHAERGFLTGGVTFCAFVPMRSVPFEVVCMLGMNDGAFPRVQRPVDFDLMSKAEPRLGDRSRRRGDRYLFLEALLSARQRLIVTYTGQSLRDNATVPSSVVVGELLDWLTDRYDPPQECATEAQRIDALRALVEIRHPLQPFSRRYFTHPPGDPQAAELFSYAEEYRAGAAAERASKPVPPLFAAPLDAPDDGVDGDGDGEPIELSALAKFFESPAGALLRNRLQLRLDDEEAELEDREPLEVERLAKWKVGDALLALRLDAVDDDRCRTLLHGRGLLPPGALGDVVFGDVLESVDAIVSATVGERGGASRSPQTVRLSLPDGTTVQGVLSDVWPAGLVQHQFGRVRAKHLLRAWVCHLAWNATVGATARSTVIGREATGDGLAVRRFAAVEAPLERLAHLVELYRLGQRAPLHLLPETGERFMESLGRGYPADAALDWARGGWNGRSESKSDGYDRYLLRVFGGSEPPFRDVCSAGGDFVQVTLEVFEPLLQSLQEGER